MIKAICKEEGKKYVEPNTKSEDSDNSTYYRVVAGSYRNRKNADSQVKKLKEKGFDSFIDVFKK